MLGRIKDILRKNSFITKLYYKTKKHDSNRKKIIRGRGNVIESNWICSHVSQRIIGDNNYVENASSVNISNTKIVIIGNNNRLEIGENTLIDDSTLWLEGNNCLLKIGKDVELFGPGIYVVEDNRKIVIGDGSMIGYRSEIRTSDSHTIADLETQERINPAKDIIFEENTWVATNAIILKGVIIGKGSIVATGAIVTKDVPANSIVAGNPARVTKTNIVWKKER